MKTKLEIAHEWATELLRSGYHRDDIISCAWQYADAMQTEADKRLAESECKEEWQPDWSQAPEWAKCWVVTREGVPSWVDRNPKIRDNSFSFRLPCGHTEAPSFGYTGDWRNSLRKRPN